MNERIITLLKDEKGTWTARDEILTIDAHADTRTEALSALDDVIDATTGEGTQEYTNEELRDAGIDPKEDRPRRKDSSRTLDELDFGGTALDGRWPSNDHE
ncbi:MULTISPECIES: type II toxin-antitoxin system HicB family antitoxin [Natrialbaceae]|uniref:type II toxin-antitoxin system HicB family antitoxin n=1 Tax=Natrialbaceae TaxID=1644061 RepID=UPI00207D5F19|nr:hypothetical protein [Natronococcus sp. CG52]